MALIGLPVRPAQRTLSQTKPVPDPQRNRKRVIVPLAAVIAILFGILLSQTSFDQPAFLNPDNNQQLLFFAALSTLIFLLFVALTFVLARNLLKLFAERRLGVLGSKFRTRLVVTGLLLSFHTGLASGPAIILVAGLFYVVSLVFGSVGGLLRQLFPGRHLEA